MNGRSIAGRRDAAAAGSLNTIRPESGDALKEASLTPVMSAPVTLIGTDPTSGTSPMPPGAEAWSVYSPGGRLLMVNVPSG